MFRKSSYSFANGNCVETGHGPGVVAVRDTKEQHLGDDRTIIEFTGPAWRTFITSIKTA